MTTLTERPAPPATEPPAWWRAAAEAPATAVVAIWATAALMSVFAPDLVSGTQQDHIPLAALTVWLWASLATAYTLMGARGESSLGLVVGVSAVWVAVMVAVLATPVLVTGTDPTRVPVAVLFAPIVGAVTTGFIALHHATTGRRLP